jgi:hypothetical protein
MTKPDRFFSKKLRGSGVHNGNSLKTGEALCAPGFYSANAASRIPTVLWRGPGVKNGMPASFPPSQALPGWRLEHSYARLPELFHKPWKLAPVRAPRLVMLNRPLARTLGLDPDVLEREENAAVFAGNKLPDGAPPPGTGLCRPSVREFHGTRRWPGAPAWGTNHPRGRSV